MQYRRITKSHQDVNSVDILAYSIIIFIVAFIVLLIVGAFIGLITWSDAKRDLDYNQTVEAFNSLPLDQRMVASEFTDMKIGPLYQAVPRNIYTVQHLMQWLPLVLLGCVLIATSVGACYDYHKNKSNEYYAADFPLENALDWFAFCFMFVEWPFFLLQRIYMHFPRIHKIIEERREIRNAAKAEFSDVQFAKTADALRANKLAHRNFVKMRANRRQEILSSQIKEARKKIADGEDRLKHLGEQIQDTQRKLNDARAKLRQLSDKPLDGYETSKEIAEQEWQDLINMRGIYRVAYSGKTKNSKNNKMQIFVRVRVPYDGDIYDFGDYCISLYSREFSCINIRSGVKADAMRTAPSYAELNKGFCFGSRKSIITDYVRAGRIIEAVTLIIDSLHTVNDDDWQAIPFCFRKVKAIEKAKKNMQNQSAK